MNAIVFYVAGALSLAFTLATVAILIGVSEAHRSESWWSISFALAFAVLAWYAAYDFAGSVEAGEGWE